MRFRGSSPGFLYHPEFPIGHLSICARFLPRKRVRPRVRTEAPAAQLRIGEKRAYLSPDALGTHSNLDALSLRAQCLVLNVDGLVRSGDRLLLRRLYANSCAIATAIPGYGNAPPSSPAQTGHAKNQAAHAATRASILTPQGGVR